MELRFPASYIQRTMWAASQRFRNAALNVMILPWRIRGTVAVPALRDALHDLVLRHPTLRTRLAMEGGQLLQVVSPDPHIELSISEAEGDSIDVRLARAIEGLRSQGRQSIDLGGVTPFKVQLVRLDVDDCILCLFVHHAMCDGWSAQILIDDLCAFYEARVGGRTAELPVLQEQYTDYCSEQIACYERGGFKEEVDYWRAQLSDPSEPMLLPVTGTRKGNRDWSCESPVSTIGAEALGAVKLRARAKKVSLFSFLLASLAVLLYQRTGSQDMTLGVPTLGRWRRESMQFVGCATNMLPARIRLTPGMPIDDLLASVHLTIRKLMAYGRIPLELLLREMGTMATAGPLYTVWCQLRESMPEATLPLSGLRLTPFVIERGTLLSELDVDMLECGGRLECEFAYRPSLLDRHFVTALMSDYGAVVSSAATAEGLSVEGLAKVAGSASGAAH